LELVIGLAPVNASEAITPSFSLKWIVLIFVLECVEYVLLMIALNEGEFHV